jgi:hypothetical protein
LSVILNWWDRLPPKRIMKTESAGGCGQKRSLHIVGLTKIKAKYSMS